MDARQKRMAQNEVLFREVNERVNEIAQDLGSDAQYDYLCECANPDCTFRLSLALGDYEAVREIATQFVVLPQHYTPEIETLVAERADHWIVSKTGAAGEYVEKLDPRGR